MDNSIHQLREMDAACVNWLGRRTPVHCTASGKAIAAFGEEAARERLLGLPLDRVTPNTITERSKLEAQLDEARQTGVARTHEELEVGLDAIAAPVFGVDGEVVAALDVSGPSHRLRNRPDLGRLTLEGAAEISRRLGYRGKRTGKQKELPLPGRVRDLRAARLLEAIGDLDVGVTIGQLPG